MLKEFAEKTKEYMVNQSEEIKVELDNMYINLINNKEITEEKKESVKTVYSYIDWVSKKN